MKIHCINCNKDFESNLYIIYIEDNVCPFCKKDKCIEHLDHNPKY